MKKKVIAIILTLIMIFSFAACGSGAKNIVKVDITEEEAAELQKFVENRKYIDQIGKGFVSAELSNQEILNLVCDEYIGAYSAFKGMNYDIILNAAENTYGYDATPEDVICRSCGEIRAVYDSSDGSINVPDSHIHDFKGDISECLVEPVEMYKNEAGDEYTVAVYKTFADLYKNTSPDREGFNFYKSYADAAAMDNVIFYAGTDVEMQEKYAALEEKDKQMYIYTFIVNNEGGFTLKSYEKA